ncbi:MAG: large conductance mechanosensitive channel protein MscL [Parcubacteria group bacterium QH_9_35_7]|nr:MAG: large conductance mechanosensitive channel protein MscL [Parcubacteria group bacterium QH_9_35_7]
MVKDFLKFLKEYKIVGLALGVVIGSASTDLVNSLVDNIIMPIISPLLPGTSWQESTFEIWQINIGWGPFLSELISFLVLAFVVYLLVKKLLRWEEIKD